MEAQEYYCIGCKRNHLKNKFYVSFNPLHNGVTPYCKKYIKNQVYIDGELALDNFKNILQQLDLPFLINHWDTSVKDSRDPVGIYFKKIKMRQNRMLKWKDSVFEYTGSQHINKTQELTSEIVNEEKYNLKDMQEKYGYGFNHEEYFNFERKYKKLSIGYKEKTAIHTERLIDYIIKKVKGEMASALGNVSDAKKWEDLAKDAATAAKLNVSQLSKSDITGGIDLIPQLVEAVEEMVSLIPIMPKLKEQPYDDADLILWANISKYREIEDKPKISYREIWDFYDGFLEEYYKQRGLDEEEITVEKQKRNNIFRDLGEVYIEPLYDDSLFSDEAEGDEI